MGLGQVFDKVPLSVGGWEARCVEISRNAQKEKRGKKAEGRRTKPSTVACTLEVERGKRTACKSEEEVVRAG